MPKQYQIRWSDVDKRELERVVRNFNQKVRRLERQGKAYLPDTLSAKELENTINTRNELNNLINSLTRFNKRRNAGNPYVSANGEIISQWEHNERVIKQRVAVAKISREISKYENESIKLLGDVQSGTFKNMGSVKLQELEGLRKSLQGIEQRTGKSQERYLKRLDKVANASYFFNKGVTYKENYIKSLENFKGLKGYDNLITKLKNVNPRKILRTYKI